MKLIRIGRPGYEKPAVVFEDKWLDVSMYFNDYNEEFFAGDGIIKLRDIVKKNKLSVIDPQGQRIGCPIARPSKIICVGLNYKKHALETNAPIPKEPILFFKSTTSLNGPFDDIIIPKNSVKTDWEVEMAVIIGKKANYIDESEAMDYIGGYCLHNDVSEREFQLERGGQWVKGKSCDTFAPLGPWLVTPDEIEQINNLRLWLKINGSLMQDGNTNDLIFNVSFLVSYISQFMTLLPGDVISTGTPHGVGLGFNPPIFLKEGDVIELGIDSLGSQKQVVKKWKG